MKLVRVEKRLENGSYIKNKIMFIMLQKNWRVRDELQRLIRKAQIR